MRTSKYLCKEGTDSVVSIGLITSEMPRTNPMFAIFEPIMLPKIKPSALLLIAEIEVNSSGAEVATETTVRPTRMLGTPNSSASSPEASHKRSPILTNVKSPKSIHVNNRKKYADSLKIRTSPHILSSISNI